MKKLTKDLFATGIHAVTGQETEEGTLSAGTLVRGIESEETFAGERWTFEASTDGGKHWFKQVSHGRPDAA